MRLLGIGHMITTTNAFVKRYLDYLKTESKAPKTIENRWRVLDPFFRKVGKLPEDITLEDIEKYLFARGLEVKSSSLQLEKQTLRGFFKYCSEYREMDLQFNWDIIKRRKVKAGKVATFTPEEIAHVVSRCVQLQDKLVICLMFETGVRIGEVLTLEVRDIEGSQIHIRGKGENDRLVYMTRELAGAVASYVADRGYYGGHVFRPLQKAVNTQDRYTNTDSIRKRIERVFKLCGYIMHPHQLRHSFAKNWLMQGGDLRTLQLLLGHADLTTTQRYLGLTDKETEAIYHRVQVKSVFSFA